MADWGDVMVCLLAAPWVQLSDSVDNGWPHNALRHHWLMPISCHVRDCKMLLVPSLTHVSGAIASILSFYHNWSARQQHLHLQSVAGIAAILLC